ncbi:MAG: hypothetical protein QNJ40_20765 [Xanthomonadales bacterium]|nr:hypothetical protein [Xanthomonadales bacterium]
MLINRANSRLLVASVLALGLIATASAQQAKDLLDRGSKPFGGAEKGPLATATLAVGGGTPGVTIGAITTFAAAQPVGVFAGHQFSPMMDFPTSYYPFMVTGAFAWVGPPIFGSPILGAGVSNPGGGPPAAKGVAGPWAAFTSAPVPAGVFSPGMLFGSRGLFAGVSVMTGQGVACGFDPGAGGVGPVLGAVTGMGRPPVAFNAATTNTSPIATPPGSYVAGCYITGATVPVELQSFSIE